MVKTVLYERFVWADSEQEAAIAWRAGGGDKRRGRKAEHGEKRLFKVGVMVREVKARAR